MSNLLNKMLKIVNFLIIAAARPPAADRPPPKPILHLGYVVRTHHINFEKNQSKDMTTMIKSVIFRLNPPLGRCSGGFCYTTDSYLTLLSLFIIKSFFNVESVT